jgi:outer membrane protein assembly factor BamA
MRLLPSHTLLLLHCALLATACRGQVKDEQDVPYIPPGETGLRVESFELLYQCGKKVCHEGSFDQDELMRGLYTQPDPGWRADLGWLPLLGKKRVTFNELEWPRDLARILAFYHARGYYNAQIANENVIRCERVEDKPLPNICDGKLGKAYIRVVVDEGMPVRVAAVRIVGASTTGLTTSELLRDAPLRTGDVFVESNYRRALDTVRARLQEQSFAYVEVTGRVVVDAQKKSADVTLFVDPGPRTVFGPIRIKERPEKIDEAYIRDTIVIRPCDPPRDDTGQRDARALARCQPFSATDLQTAQRDLYDLGIFSLVNLQPDFSSNASAPRPLHTQAPPSEAELALAQPLGISALLSKLQTQAAARARLDPVVPLDVSLKEAKNWTVRLGAGAGIDLNARRDIQARATISSRNFLGLLGRLELFNAAGYAWAGNDTLGLSNEGFILTSELRYTQPRVIERKLELRLLGRAERDVQLGYKVISPSGSIGLHRRFFDIIDLSLSYNISFYQYDNLTDIELREQLGAARSDTRPAFLLEYLEQRAAISTLNNPIDPTRGVSFELSLQQASDLIAGGEATYLRPRISLDGYIPIGGERVWAVLAARASLGSIYNLSESTSDGPAQPIPFTARLYGGGRGSLRSVGNRFLSFFSDATRPIPIGAITLIEASVEPRMRLVRNFLDVGDVWLAPFLDVGSFQNEPFMFSTSDAGGATTDLAALASTLLYGVGVGIWWKTPVGPVRFDLARSINVEGDPRLSNVNLSNYNFFLGIGHSF